MKITDKKILTYITIFSGIAICMFLLFYSGQVASLQGGFICRENQLSVNFLLLIVIMWLIGFIIYKVSVHEKLIVKITEVSEQMKNLGESNQELLNYLINQQELDFVELQHFNYNTRELILKYFNQQKRRCKD